MSFDKSSIANQTPVDVCRWIINQLDWIPGETVLEPCRGSGNFYNNLPFNVIKDWAEIEPSFLCHYGQFNDLIGPPDVEPRDFLLYNRPCDVVITNPPFKSNNQEREKRINLPIKFLEHSFDLARRRVVMLFNHKVFAAITPARVERWRVAGWELTHLDVISITKWFGRYFVLRFDKNKPGILGSTLQSLSTLIAVPTGIIYTNTSDGSLAASINTSGTLIGNQTGVSPAGTLTLDANIWRPGRILRIKGSGLLTTSVAGPTLKIDIKLGSVVVASSGAITPISGITNGGFSFEATLICRTTGSSGTIQGDGWVVQESLNGLAGVMNSLNQPTATVNTTASQAVDCFATWSAGTAGNNVTLSVLSIEWGN